MKKIHPLLPIMYLIIFVLGVIYVASKKDSLVEVKEIRERTDNYSLILMKEMGYGGLIHNFKNYLIRRNEADYQKAKLNVKKLKSLDLMIHQVKNPLIIQNHASLFVMIDHYNEALDVIKSLKNQPIESVDKLVAFNDSGALSIIKDIEQANKLTTAAYNKAAEELWMVMVGFVITCFILFLSSVLQALRENRVNYDFKRINDFSKDKSEQLKRVEGILFKLVFQALPGKVMRNSNDSSSLVYKLDGAEIDVEFAKLAIFVLLNSMKNQVEYTIIRNELTVSGVERPENLARAITLRLEKMGIFVKLIEK